MSRICWYCWLLLLLLLLFFFRLSTLLCWAQSFVVSSWTSNNSTSMYSMRSLTQIIFMSHTRPIKPVFGTKTKRAEWTGEAEKGNTFYDTTYLKTQAQKLNTLKAKYTSILLFIPTHYECINIRLYQFFFFLKIGKRSSSLSHQYHRDKRDDETLLFI